MKKFFYKSSVLALAAGVLLTSCDPEIDAPDPSSGEADFSTYVALGNSLTSGFQDGALYREGQLNSYAVILADQFETVGGDSDFRVPLLAEGVSVGSPVVTPNGVVVPKRLVLAPVTDCLGNTSLAPVSSGLTDLSAFAPSAVTGPYNNLGVPGAKSFHLLAPGYGNPAGVAQGTANPFFARFASSPNTSVLADALAQDPTFFTLWIGNNDVLGYALAGGTPQAGEREYPTDKALFQTYIGAIVTQLTAGGAKGAVANIPDVDKIPYFNTVPVNGLVLTAAQAQGLTAAYAQQGLTNITFQAGANNFVVNEDGQIRKLKNGEKILLNIPQDQLKCQGLGSMTPIDDRYVLSEEELALIAEYTASYNATIQGIAQAQNLAFVDANAYLDRLASGFAMSGVNYSSTLVTGNVFSLDGIHFAPRGAAIVANEFIKAINAKYKSTVPLVDETQYRTVLLP